MDKASILDENRTQFWALCGQTKDSGVAYILENEAVQFKNVRTHENEVEETPKDIKSLKMRDYIETIFKQEVSNSTNLEQVLLVGQI